MCFILSCCRGAAVICKSKACYICASAMSDGFRCWADLPDGLLDSIIARLGASRDLFAFEATCRSWRAAFSSCPAGFPPLLLRPDVSLCSSCPPTFRKIMVPTRPCRVTNIANRDTTHKFFEIPIFWIPRGKKAPPSPLDFFLLHWGFLRSCYFFQQ